MVSLKRIAPTFAWLLCATFSSAADVWVPIAAHNPGASGTFWRTDLSIHNPCDLYTEVEIVAHADEGDFTRSYEVPPKTQWMIPDILGQLTSIDTTASLEIRSESEVVTNSRTFNLTPEGTYGQGFDSVEVGTGLLPGDVALLPQLQQNDHFRTNIGVLNMGTGNLGVTVHLFDRDGAKVGTFHKVVPAGRAVLDTESFRSRFGRNDIFAGFAEVEIVYGSGGWPFASVVDQGTGDPSTVLPRQVPECSRSIDDLLAEIDGMEVEELDTQLEGHRFFELRYTQPVDHDDPGGAVFTQHLTLLHRSAAAPMVLNTLGYSGDGYLDLRSEPTVMLNANQLRVEHRFFSSSTPSPRDWSTLTIEQAAADHHRVVEAIKPLYRGAWINTGASKGGMTAVYHRRFYPEDVDVTIAYVAPLSLGAPDDRYVTFLEQVGDAQCRDDLLNYQRELLSRRGPMLGRAEDFYERDLGLTFDRIGGLETAFESAVIELSFSFWQFWGPNQCSQIPDSTATDDEVFNFFTDDWAMFLASDNDMDLLGPYFFQAASQLGYPALSATNLEDLLVTDWVSLEKGLTPVDSNPVFDPTSIPDIQQWVLAEGENMLFVYGEVDPWSAGAFKVDESVGSYRFWVEDGTHSAMITALSSDNLTLVRDLLENWTGIRPKNTWIAIPDPEQVNAPFGRYDNRILERTPGPVF